MTGVQAGLVAQLVLVVVAAAAALLAPAARRSTVCGSVTAVLGAVGGVTGAAVLNGRHGTVSVPTALPLGPVELDPSPLGGFFMVVVGGVGLAAAVYAIGYAAGPAASRTTWAAWAFFLAGLLLVPAAGDAVSFLLAWEVMAVASTVLVLTDHPVREEVRSAGLWYAAMTHLSFALLLAGFGVLAGAGGGLDWASMQGVDPHSPAAGVGFVLLTAGFATKAGIVPLHVWLPRAHPAAPSHVSAVMSAAMVKLGVYGALLVTLRLLPDGPSWWAVVLLALGAVSAVYGILQASVTSDLKRLLAYSTTENVGLMFLALGAGLLLRVHHVAGAADAAIVACLLLVAGHAAFKTGLFLAAGSVLHATGERDLDRMGGLGRRMPVTGLVFGVCALGAASLPVTAGFVAEWTLLQAVIHGAAPEDRTVAVLMPFAVTVVALTAGLALLTFVKAYGIAFLARPRSDGAAGSHEAARGMQGAMLAAAATVVGLGLLPGVMVRAAARATGVDLGAASPARISLPGLDARLEPVAILAVAALALAAVAAVAAAASGERRHVDLAWGCGGVRANPRMQYTATSYAEPLARVFDDALRPERDVVVTHAVESQYLVERVQYRQQVVDLMESRLYRPGLRMLDRVGVAARGLQNGSIHRYLGYSFLALVLVLVAVSR